MTEQIAPEWFTIIINKYDLTGDDDFMDELALVMRTDPDNWVSELSVMIDRLKGRISNPFAVCRTMICRHRLIGIAVIMYYCYCLLIRYYGVYVCLCCYR